MEFIIVSGLSGAGKSRAVDALEDIGFYCVDNMPGKLLPKFAELCMQSQDRLTRVAIVIDARGGMMLDGLFEGLEELKRQGGEYKILFLECGNQELARRYKETRRKHPLTDEGRSVQEAIEAEREILKNIRARTDYLIDTTHTTPAQLREQIFALFLEDSQTGMKVQCMSFGFKYGYPAEADIVMDVRCFPNPFYIDKLRHKTGLDTPVREYVLSSPEVREFLEKLTGMADFLLPLYRNEGKSQLIIAIGCTGGKHRSVTIAEELAMHLNQEGARVMVKHRDIQKN
ncbi:MAG: RNase adapter RapZ [Oscillospiraceae bacterium]|nr:RNase adapter RapZ [Oscillospiraceae bacterium]